MRKHAGLLVGYGLSIVVSALVTLIGIPIVIGHSGANAWASLAVGQAVGTGAAMLIGYGWGTTGPTAVARANDAERRRIYFDSFRARLLLFLPITLAAVIVTSLAVHYSVPEASVNAVGYCLSGLLAGWYFTGIAQPYLFLLLDAGPRVAGAAAGTAAVFFGAPLMAFAGFQLVGILVGVLLSTRFVAGGNERIFRDFDLRRTFEVLGKQSHGVAIAIVLAANVAVPSAIVAFVAPAALPAFALADKLLRFGTTAYAPIVQFLQGWVPTGSTTEVTRKIKAAFLLGGLSSLAGAVLFVFVAPLLSSLLSQAQVGISTGLVVGFGLALFVMELAQFTGLVCLLALNQAQRIALFSSIGIVVSLPAIFFGALTFGATGAAWMMAFGELVAFVPQLVLLRIALAKASLTADVTGALGTKT